MSNRVLLLNADANPLSLLPLSTVHWQTAVKYYFHDKARILHEYPDDWLRSANFSMLKPSVIILNRFQRIPNKAKYTRRNVFIRDNNLCQYCSNKFSFDELTIDHVIPRVMGGKSTWENTVASCQKCNTTKGKRLMKPISKPYKPSWYQINQHAKQFTINIPDQNWQSYLQWPEDKIVLGSH